MTTQPNAVPVVQVAVGAVVENVSTIDQASPDTAQHARFTELTPEHVRLLITRRRTGQVFAGLWELPGGKIERDESPQQAVVRELREEVGIEIEPIHALPPVEHAYAHATVCLLPFVCRRLSGLPEPIEVADARWVSLHELDAYDFPEASLPVLGTLHELLGK